MNIERMRKMMQDAIGNGCVGFVDGADELKDTLFKGMVITLADMIDRVIFHDPATIIIWRTGQKTVVKVQNGEEFDKEKGLALAVMKYVNGNGGNYNEIIKKWCE